MLIDKYSESNNHSLIRQNSELRLQLRQAQAIIKTLNQKIEQLQNQLKQYKNFQSPRSKPIRMQVEQHFEVSSDEGDKDTEQQSNSSPVARTKTNHLTYSSDLPKRDSQSQIEIAQKKVIFNLEEECSRKSINKVLKKSSERKKLDPNIKQEENFHSAKEIPLSTSFFSKDNSTRDITTTQSEKMLFRKTSNSKPIYDYFFVTGITKEGPCISYSYPHENTNNFQAYLSLLYSENSLRQPDLSPSNSKSKNSSKSITSKHKISSSTDIYIRDTFVIPIIKSQAKSNQKDYLIICEVEQNALERDLAGWRFPRYYCFLSQWKFFLQFKKLISQLIDRIITKRRQYTAESLSEKSFTTIVQHQVEQGISFLHQKTTDYNKTLDCCIGNSGLRFSADIPPIQMSYQLIEKFTPWKILDSTVQFKIGDTQNPSVETKLMGVLVAYALAQVKMVLYSSVKSKISEALLQLLQIIKPLAYVNPIILATLKEDHQELLGAPMSIILGLWSEQKRSSRQKIEIFMNKKLNLMGMIQKAKLNLPDGIVINLDTGLIFGGGVDVKLTKIAQKLNIYRHKYGKHSRDLYKMIQRMLYDKSDSIQTKQLWNQLMTYIKNTQIYCYYMENRQQ